MERGKASEQVNPLVKQYGQPFVPPDDTPPDSWLLRPELPESSEVWNADSNRTPHVNCIKGPWSTKEDYLRAHYELLREDALSGLRDALREVKMRPEMGDSDNTHIYDQVRLIGYTLSHQGLAARVIFSTRRAGKRIRWPQSKRLVPGTLVALTPTADMFQSQCIMAVVAARPVSGLQRIPPEVDIFFSKPSECVVDPTEEWVMVEAKSGYFESVRHTLVGLQRLARESFPLSEHLLHLEKSISVPEHMIRSPMADWSSLTYDETSKRALASVNAMESFPEDFPKQSLDESQLQALQRMLTKRLAIVQGPPGTGKTYVSVTLLRLLLNRRSDDDPPILVVSHTNHALDQMLRHVSRYEDTLIRLGSRTSDEEIKKHTLRAKRKQRPPPDLIGGLRVPVLIRMTRHHKKITKVLEPFNKLNEPFSADELHRLGLLTDTQRRSLEEDGKNWVVGHRSVPSSSPMAKWLAADLVPVDEHDRMGDYRDNPALEYEDAELDDDPTKDMEVDSGVIDDDVEGLSGPWRPIKKQLMLRRRYGIVPRTVERALETDDLWSIPPEHRASVYLMLEQKAMTIIRDSFRAEAEEYAEITRDLQVGKWESDLAVVERAKVVGMTATGLSKYRPLIAALRPKILLVEEAAETLEGSVTAGCVESLEHLILVGDHQQLRAHCANKALQGNPFHLDVSMFERLIINNVEFSQLQCQRRMIPEIRMNLRRIYPDMTDHQSVLSRPSVPGMGDVKSFFFSHVWPESRDQQSSCCNRQEAVMVLGFFNYLIYNGVQPERITVLTFYNGQRRIILNTLLMNPMLLGRLNIKTVDSYQGEENDIVLLSLVRSNSHGQIGFLGDEHRACVALSRARNGFYLFGNLPLLAKRSPIWETVLRNMSTPPPRVGPRMPLECVRHRLKVDISDPSFWKDNQGGCGLVCKEPLKCEHLCELKCHPFGHDRVGKNETASQSSSKKSQQLKSPSTEGLYKPRHNQSNRRIPAASKDGDQMQKTKPWTSFAQRAAAGKLDEKKEYHNKFPGKKGKNRSKNNDVAQPTPLLIDLDDLAHDDDNSTNPPPAMPSHSFNIPLIGDDFVAATLEGDKDKEGKKSTKDGKKPYVPPAASISLMDMDIEIDKDIWTVLAPTGGKEAGPTSAGSKEAGSARAGGTTGAAASGGGGGGGGSGAASTSVVTDVTPKDKKGKNENENQQKNDETGQPRRRVWYQTLDYSSVLSLWGPQQSSASASVSASSSTEKNEREKEEGKNKDETKDEGKGDEA
ncbi:MAG: hypothetical protein M1823_005696 [Watsoniomyces obsoletus]|nr:MAG: hypothetical protein M1823_005696 [Watsoniomyces obsoletus]